MQWPVFSLLVSNVQNPLSGQGISPCAFILCTLLWFKILLYLVLESWWKPKILYRKMQISTTIESTTTMKYRCVWIPLHHTLHTYITTTPNRFDDVIAKNRYLFFHSKTFQQFHLLSYVTSSLFLCWALPPVCCTQDFKILTEAAHLSSYKIFGGNTGGTCHN